MALTKPKLSTNINTDIGEFSDPVLVLHQGATLANADVGFLFNRANGLVSNVAVIWQESSKSLVHIYTTDSGVPSSNLSVQGYANVSVGNVLMINNAGIYVNGTLGSAGQVLASDGSKTYWAAPGGFTGGTVSGQTTFQSNLVVSNTTPSTSNVTGALVVSGGVGVSGNIYTQVLYTAAGIRWAGNGNVFASGGGGGAFAVSSSPPSAPKDGDFWYKTTTDVLYQRLDDGLNAYWVDVQSPTISSNTVSVISTGTTDVLSPFLLAGM